MLAERTLLSEAMRFEVILYYLASTRQSRCVLKVCDESGSHLISGLLANCITSSEAALGSLAHLTSMSARILVELLNF